MDKKESEIKIKINTKSAFILGIISGVLLVVIGSALLILYHKPSAAGKTLGSSVMKIEKAAAAEIYPEFVCGCCGQPLDKNNICCGIAEDMIAYIDSQVENNLSKEEVIFATVKKYGIKSLASEETTEDIKEKLAQNAPEDRPKIYIDPASFDLGEISQGRGVVSQNFAVQNKGKSDLIINNLLTSCGCTTASLIVNGQEGPRFGMHNNPKNWSATIEPDQKAELKVYYDPKVHPEFRGEATREITIFSNDPIDFEKEIRIKLNQVD